MNNLSSKKIGIYAIVHPEPTPSQLINYVYKLLDSNISMLQYRNKTNNKSQIIEDLIAIKPLCAKFKIPLIVNDHIEICKTLDLDGVHLGNDDMPIEQARKYLAKKKIIGATCHGCLKLAAQKAPFASYLAFGACFASTTKPLATIVPLEIIATAKKQFNLPIVAIGGINQHNIHKLIELDINYIGMASALKKQL